MLTANFLKVDTIPTQVVHHNIVPVQQTVVTQQPVLLQPPPRQPVVLHHVHGEPGKALSGGMGADIGRAQNALPPGVIPGNKYRKM